MYNVVYKEKIPCDWKHPVPRFSIALQHNRLVVRWRWKGHWYSYMRKI
jgi:hypothetical protein